MPRFLPPDEVEALREKGVVFPGEVAPIPSETVVRALGDIGLPHSEKVERLETDQETPGSIESIVGARLFNSYVDAHEATLKIMALVDESIPNMLGNSEFGSQLESLQPAYEVFESHRLEPEVVLTPVHRELDFWKNLVRKFRTSLLNPYQLDPDPFNSGGFRKVLRGAGLDIDSSVGSHWGRLAYPDGEDSSWQLSVTSGVATPRHPNITSSGWAGEYNPFPVDLLNNLLDDLKQPLVPRDSANNLTTQLDIHPTVDAYIMHQLSRLAHGLEPVDTDHYSFLKGGYAGVMGGVMVPIGHWNTTIGKTCLEDSQINYRNSLLGIRPSVRANHA